MLIAYVQHERIGSGFSVGYGDLNVQCKYTWDFLCSLVTRGREKGAFTSRYDIHRQLLF